MPQSSEWFNESGPILRHRRAKPAIAGRVINVASVDEGERPLSYAVSESCALLALHIPPESERHGEEAQSV